MAKKADVAAGAAAPGRASHERQSAQQPGAPRWLAWIPPAAILWALACGAVRVWWAIGGAPYFGPLGTDLIAFSGWGAVGLYAAVLAAAIALRTAAWRRWLLIAAWGVSSALVMASGLLLLDVVAGLLPGLGVPFHPMAFVSRAASLLGGILLGASAEAYRRRWHSACLFCGRTRARTQRARPAQPPRWARWAAYVAVAGWLVRLGAQVGVGFGSGLMPTSGGALLAFEAGFVLAGTVLPLALVHSWGQVVPGWMPLLAGRRLPRWLLLVPGFGIGAAMTAYFGFTLVTLAVQTLSGTWDQQSAGALPLTFFWVAVPAYLAWGLGLGIAALGYYQITRPPCPVCGR